MHTTHAKLTTRIPLVIMLICAIVSGCANRAMTQGSEPVQLRVMTYNIHHGAGMDGNIDLERIARIITDAGADIVALQEVDNKTTRSGRVDQAAELGRLTGMHHRFGKAINYQGGEYGQAILSRWPIESFTVHQLPTQAGQEQRIAIAAEIAGDSRRPTILFTGTHLHHADEALRLPQAVRLITITRQADQKVQILAGDLNAVPTSQTMQIIKADWEDTTPNNAFTIPSGVPNRKIDYIMLPKMHSWRVVRSEVLNEPIASDHRPILTVLEWAGGETLSIR